MKLGLIIRRSINIFKKNIYYGGKAISKSFLQANLAKAAKIHSGRISASAYLLLSSILASSLYDAKRSMVLI